MNDFKKNKYCVIKNVLSEEMSDFLYHYSLLKKQCVLTMINSKYLNPFETLLGMWEDKQVKDTYSHYADFAMETLLYKFIPIMEQHTKLKLVPTYSYMRIYKKGDVLARHKDRDSCEISTTLNLGGDAWPIFVSPNENVGIANIYGGKKNITMASNAKGSAIDLAPGDMLVYRGCELEHWREEFQGDHCVQVFLHYNKKGSKLGKENLMDKRPHLGLPVWFKGK
jgi:hypothetical protein